VDRLKEKQIILQLRSKESMEVVAVHRRKEIDLGGGGSSSHA
jgi:hypothetical protein